MTLEHNFNAYMYVHRFQSTYGVSGNPHDSNMKLSTNAFLQVNSC